MKKELMFSGPAFRNEKNNTVRSSIPDRMKKIFGNSDEILEPDFSNVELENLQNENAELKAQLEKYDKAGDRTKPELAKKVVYLTAENEALKDELEKMLNDEGKDIEEEVEDASSPEK